MQGNRRASEDADTVALIKSIPMAMRNMGWTVSAQLIERWLQAPAWVLPRSWKQYETSPREIPFTHIEKQLVRMSWAMSHQRVQEAKSALLAKMTNDPAQRNLGKKLSAANLERGKWTAFGSKHYPVLDLERVHQSNFTTFGRLSDPMDDLYGSLGEATLKVALIGLVMRHEAAERFTFKVTDAGFYIRDTYDFNGDQYLGAWAKDRVLSLAQTALNFPRRDQAHRGSPVPITHVTNSHFDSYRRATGFGGDFVIYSNVIWEPTPMVLEIEG